MPVYRAWPGPGRSPVMSQSSEACDLVHGPGAVTEDRSQTPHATKTPYKAEWSKDLFSGLPEVPAAQDK